MGRRLLRALVALAGVLAVIGIAGAFVTPAVPGPIGLGLALALVGVGMISNCRGY